MVIGQVDGEPELRSRRQRFIRHTDADAQSFLPGALGMSL